MLHFHGWLESPGHPLRRASSAFVVQISYIPTRVPLPERFGKHRREDKRQARYARVTGYAEVIALSRHLRELRISGGAQPSADTTTKWVPHSSRTLRRVGGSLIAPSKHVDPNPNRQFCLEYEHVRTPRLKRMVKGDEL